ncbi:MAG: ThuA domain-containing protein [Cellulophaga sp.]
MRKQLMKGVLTIIIATIVLSCTKREQKVLVFSKTVEFRHGAIEAGIEAIKKIGLENGFKVVTTEDAAYIVEDSLINYSSVIFLNTTGDILNYEQQADFERYIQAGGGFLGIHAATDTEYDWPWYNKLVGAYFEGHPSIQEATLRIMDNSHISTKHLDSIWVKSDEWYNFKEINPAINVLLEIDETSYEGGTNGAHHPISWYHDYDGGQSFYIEMGHTKETYGNPLFLKHLLGGIIYTIGKNSLDYSKVKSDRVPPENRFVKKVLDFNLNEPMELDELPGIGILFIERQGALKLFDFKTEQTETIAQLELFYGNEDGLLGLAVDPNYEENNWIYMFYTAAGEVSIQHISRFTLKENVLDFESEKILFKIPTERKCCHSGGALEFGPNGNLFIGVGDNTNPFESSGFSPIDEREGRAQWDAQRSSANTNDLRGKILRIKPENDGTYSIPKGNLFPEGMANTRPEIYIMGCRNPFRISIDSKTKYLNWGDVGPDSGVTVADRGPKGMGEFNQARKAGFWGWPYTRGDNQAYNDYDFTTRVSGPKFDPNNVINDSPNNTGIKKMPPIQESQIWFSYDRSMEFPWLGDGGVNPMGGPVFHKEDYLNAKETFPSYFEDKYIAYEWMRDWIYIVTLDENQDYLKAEQFMPSTEFSHPMDMLFGADGKLYVLEYGQKWNVRNMDARLSSISYLRGNREPIAKITTDKLVGAAPLKVQFSGLESEDYDKDKLIYEWTIDGNEVESTEESPSFTFNKNGIFTVQLKVTDSKGETAKATTKILVGNDAPEITIEINEEGLRYWDNKKLRYTVNVTDKQDGSTLNGTINASNVKVTFDYIPEGQDMIKATMGHQQNVTPEGLKIIKATDCKACHAIDEKVNGPSYIDIAEKYNIEDKDYLVSKIIKGGVGVWGETMMAAHPQLSIEEVNHIVDYILSLKPNAKPTDKKMPLKGVVAFKGHMASDNEGIYVLMASYLDKGIPGQEESALSVRSQLIFKNLRMEAENADGKSDGLGDWTTGETRLVGSIVHDSYLQYDDLSLKNLKEIKFSAFYGGNYHYKGILEIREGSLNGKVIGTVATEYFNKKESMKYYRIPVNPTVDKGSLFIVFKNEADKEQYIANANWFLLKYLR